MKSNCLGILKLLVLSLSFSTTPSLAWAPDGVENQHESEAGEYYGESIDSLDFMFAEPDSSNLPLSSSTAELFDDAESGEDTSAPTEPSLPTAFTESGEAVEPPCGAGITPANLDTIIAGELAILKNSEALAERRAAEERLKRLLTVNRSTNFAVVRELHLFMLALERKAQMTQLERNAYTRAKAILATIDISREELIERTIDIARQSLRIPKCYENGVDALKSIYTLLTPPLARFYENTEPSILALYRSAGNSGAAVPLPVETVVANIDEQLELLKTALYDAITSSGIAVTNFVCRIQGPTNQNVCSSQDAWETEAATVICNGHFRIRGNWFPFLGEVTLKDAPSSPEDVDESSTESAKAIEMKLKLGAMTNTHCYRAQLSCARQLYYNVPADIAAGRISGFPATLHYARQYQSASDFDLGDVGHEKALGSFEDPYFGIEAGEVATKNNALFGPYLFILGDWYKGLRASEVPVVEDAVLYALPRYRFYEIPTWFIRLPMQPLPGYDISSSTNERNVPPPVANESSINPDQASQIPPM